MMNEQLIRERAQLIADEFLPEFRQPEILEKWAEATIMQERLYKLEEWRRKQMEKTLTLTSSQLAEIFAHLDAGKPDEACGLLGGQGGRVEKVYLTANATPSPVRYSIKPEELVQAIVEIEERGWELLGIFHSHPAGPPTPSATDIAEAYYPDSAYVICAPDSGRRWQARAFEIKNGEAREIPIRVES